MSGWDCTDFDTLALNYTKDILNKVRDSLNCI